MKIFSNITLIYDADCAFCIRSLKTLRRFDAFGKITVIPSTAPGVRTLCSALEAADFDDAMYAVANGRSYRGFAAFRAAALACPALLPIGLLAFVPPWPSIGAWVYGWVAANRRRFGCAL